MQDIEAPCTGCSGSQRQEGVELDAIQSVRGCIVTCNWFAGPQIKHKQLAICAACTPAPTLIMFC